MAFGCRAGGGVVPLASCGWSTASIFTSCGGAELVVDGSDLKLVCSGKLSSVMPAIGRGGVSERSAGSSNLANNTKEGERDCRSGDCVANVVRCEDGGCIRVLRGWGCGQMWGCGQIRVRALAGLTGLGKATTRQRNRLVCEICLGLQIKRVSRIVGPQSRPDDIRHRLAADRRIPHRSPADTRHKRQTDGQAQNATERHRTPQRSERGQRCRAGTWGVAQQQESAQR